MYHTDLRDNIARCCILDEFDEAVIATREAVIEELARTGKCEDEVYTEKWYIRHRNPTHMHSGRVGSEFIRDPIPQDRTLECTEDGCNVFEGLGMFEDGEE